MEHKHSVLDSDVRFIIDPVTRAVKNTSKKTTIIQFDHNSERATFELPRYVEKHDMSLCNKVEVHYQNVDVKTKEQKTGIYEITDLQVDPEDENKVICSWLISRNATQLVGLLNFVIRYSCIENGIVTYSWNTLFNTELIIGTGFDASELVLTEYVDVIEQWKETVMQTFRDDLTAWKETKAEELQADLTAWKEVESDEVHRVMGDYETYMNKQLDIERKRIDAFVALKDGSTTGDAELQDIRVDADGVTHDSAGTAVRKQVADIKAELGSVVRENLIDYDTLQPGYVTADGTVNESCAIPNFEYRTPHIAIERGGYILQCWANPAEGKAGWYGIGYYAADDTFIRRESSEFSDAHFVKTLSVPDGAAYMIVSFRKTLAGKVKLERGKIPTPYSARKRDNGLEYGVIDGYYLSGFGNLVPNSANAHGYTHQSTTLIKVNPGDTLHIEGTWANNPWCAYCTYDVNGNFIERVQTNVSGEKNGDFLCELTITVPEDVCFVRFSWRSSENTNLAITTGGFILDGKRDLEISLGVERLNLVKTTSYPDATNFEYTETTAASAYLVAKPPVTDGGMLVVDYNPEIANNFNLNIFLFDKSGNPYKHTADIDSIDKGRGYTGYNYSPIFNKPGTATGFGHVLAPFTVKIPKGYRPMISVRFGYDEKQTGRIAKMLENKTSEFINWAVNGGLRIYVCAENENTVTPRIGYMKGVAHRGYSKIAPENTLPAYILARKMGFEYAECDVLFTSDNVPVLLHDGSIDRTSDGTGIISGMTYEQASQFDYGSWKGDEYAKTKIPTFEEFIFLCRNIGLHPYIEVKGGRESQMQLLVSIVKRFGMADKCTWISFSASCLSYIKKYDSNARLGYVVDAVTDTVIGTALDLQTDSNSVFIDTNISDTSGMNLAGLKNVPVEVWTVNDEDKIIALPDNVSGVTSDFLNAGTILFNHVMNE